MKKLLLVLAVATLAFVACNDSGNTEETPKTDTPAVTAPAPTVDTPATTLDSGAVKVDTPVKK